MTKLTNPPLILASGSPRRVEFLKSEGFDFTVIPADIDESSLADEAPLDCALRLALRKATSTGHKQNSDTLILAADTLIGFKSKILGKPSSRDDAFEILKTLLGQTHDVITGYCILKTPSEIISHQAVTSKVTMRDASDDEIWDYINTGEPMDKAGAYALQGIGKKFVMQVEGSQTNVIGLPIEEIAPLLKRYL